MNNIPPGAGEFTPEDHINATFDLFFEPGSAVEIRAFSDRGRFNGFFDDPKAFLMAAVKQDKLGRKGIYVTLNAVPPAFLALRNNRIDKAEKATADADIVRRAWLLVDADPRRNPSEISSTDVEKGRARLKLQEVMDFLSGLGFPEPIVADSGNGYHGLYPIDLPRDDDGLVRNVLTALDALFSNEQVKIDTSVSNPARITKLYGTMVRKGEDTEDRPHRRSGVLYVPDTREPASRETLEAVVALGPQPEPPPAGEQRGAGGVRPGQKFDVQAFLQKYEIPVLSGPRQWDGMSGWGGSTLWIVPCPFIDHGPRDRAAHVIQAPDGRVSFRCKHDHCEGRDWKQFRRHYEPGYDPNREYAPAARGGRRSGDDKPDQIDLVDRWRERNPDIRFGAGSWREYRDGYWPEIPEATVEKSILAIIKEARAEGIKPSANLLTSLTALARVEVRVPEDVWDSPERGIIVCQNGTLEINGRKLREHRPEDYALYAVAFPYDPEAKAEAWELTFAGRLGKSWEFLQEYAGYSLTTRTEHETAVFLLGDPGCGKSTFVEGITTVLGERSRPLSLAQLAQSKFALANVPGRTLLTATESPHMYLKSTAILDTLISGEPMEVERKYERPEAFRPVAKVLWAMNETPQVRNPNAGFFRRVKIVPFPPLGETKQNPLVKELIKTEGSGILNWALDGLDRLNAQRTFTVSPAMEAEGQEFRQENDIPALFIAETCEPKADGRVRGSELYRRYADWCRDSGHNPIGKNRIGKEWQRLGFKEIRPKNVVHYAGLELKETHVY
jgi:P4 family phage/plasmid primase-like protien